MICTCTQNLKYNLKNKIKKERKRTEKIYYANSNHKKAEVALPISDKIDSKMRNVT